MYRLRKAGITIYGVTGFSVYWKKLEKNMKKTYTCIIFDVDDTLLDYKQSEHGIMDGIFAKENRILQETEYERLWQLSWFYWDKYQLSNTADEEVQKHFHEWYHTHLYEYMEKLREEFQVDMSKEMLHDLFIELFKEQVWPYEDTEEVLAILSQRYCLAAATNGLTEVQKHRLSRYNGYISHVFVSEEIGICKPGRAFWEHVMEQLGVKKEDCLMVGDSLTSDIKGAMEFGIDTCWLNRNGRVAGETKPLYEIQKLDELIGILIE